MSDQDLCFAEMLNSFWSYSISYPSTSRMYSNLFKFFLLPDFSLTSSWFLFPRIVSFCQKKKYLPEVYCPLK